MEEQNKICPSCGASNDPSYSFCHICGTALNAATGAGTGNYPQNSQFGGQYGNGSAYGEYNGAAGNYGSPEPQTIAGCPTEAVRAFVGPGKLFDKLVKTELTQSKVSWVWPVVILALLFGSGGIMFASLWFFYRRMSKWGLLTALCGLVLYAVNCFVYLRAFQPVITVYYDMIKDMVNSGFAADLDPNLYIQRISEIMTSKSFLAGALVSRVITFINIGGGILLAMFGVSFYKSHIASKLPPLLESNTPVFVISQRGGKSSPAVVLAVIAILIIETVLSVAAFLI